MNDISDSLAALNKWHLHNIIFGDTYSNLITLKMFLFVNKRRLKKHTFTECSDMEAVTRSDFRHIYLS